MPKPVYAVEVRKQRGVDLRFVRAESPEAAAQLARAWEVPVVAVRPEPLSAEERARLGKKPSELPSWGCPSRPADAKLTPVSKAAAAVLCAGAALAATAGAAPSFFVRGDERIGGYAVKANGTLAGAINAFGVPSSKSRRLRLACLVAWQSEGLTILFNNFGGGNPCSPRGGYFARAVMHGAHWRTAKGLRVGMRAARVRQFYPRAKWHRGERGVWPTGWWLVTRPSLYGNGLTYPGLLAETRNGRVFSLQVRYPAGGD